MTAKERLLVEALRKLRDEGLAGSSLEDPERFSAHDFLVVAAHNRWDRQVRAYAQELLAQVDAA